MKKQTTYIDAIHFETLLKDLKFKPLAQAGFVKVAGKKGRNVYIAKTKRVGRIDLSGFEVKMVGIEDLGGEAFGAVKQQVDFSRTQDEILATTKAVLEHMVTPEARVIERKSPAPKANAPKGWSKKVATKKAPTESAKARQAAIKERALLLSTRTDGGATPPVPTETASV
jgi:hypothetical protein